MSGFPRTHINSRCTQACLWFLLEKQRQEISQTSWLGGLAISASSGFDWEMLSQWIRWKSDGRWFLKSISGLDTCLQYVCPHTCAQTHVSQTHDGAWGAWEGMERHGIQAQLSDGKGLKLTREISIVAKHQRYSSVRKRPGPCRAEAYNPIVKADITQMKWKIASKTSATESRCIMLEAQITGYPGQTGTWGGIS